MEWSTAGFDGLLSTGSHLVQPRSQGREKAIGTRLHLVLFSRWDRVFTRIPSLYQYCAVISAFCSWLFLGCQTQTRPQDAFFLALEVGPHTKPGKSALGTRLGQTEKFPPYSCRLLLITTLVEWLHREKTGQSILIIAIVSITANNKPFLDVVHHWFCLLQWVIWVTKPIYILTFSYRPKSSSIMYCKAIYPSGLWLLTNDDCCAKNKVVSRVLAPARSW